MTSSKTERQIATLSPKGQPWHTTLTGLHGAKTSLQNHRGAPESAEVGMLNGKMIYSNIPAWALNLSLADGSFAAQCPAQGPFAVIYLSTSQPGTILIVRG